MDYQREYTDYWSRTDRWGSHSFQDPEPIAEQIMTVCGAGKLLDVGCGMGLLVRTLVGHGVDAYGIDIAPRPVGEANRLAEGRFKTGSILEIPFEDETFETAVSTDCLEHVAENDIPRALAELYRVARRFVFIRLATTPDRDNRWHLTIHDRPWWEARFFEAGFRKHPLNQLVNPDESLAHDDWQITLVFEKIPQAALAKYPRAVLASLRREADLHLKAGRYEAAGDLFQQICHLDPSDVDSLFRQAACRERAGQFVLASLLYKELLEKEPQHAAACERIAFTRAGKQSPNSKIRTGRQPIYSPCELDVALDEILTVCGAGRILVVGASPEPVVTAMLARGVDCLGLDPLETAEANGRCLGGTRCRTGQVLKLPFDDHSFESVWVINSLENLDETALVAALHELARVTRRSLVVRIATGETSGQAVRNRMWWEPHFFSCGFRKHPLRFLTQPSESLHNEHGELTLLLERVVDSATAQPTDADASLQSGRPADAVLAPYEFAARYVRPGDTVLALGCQSGFGLYLLKRATRAAKFIGIDEDEKNVEYAKTHLGVQSPLLEFRCSSPVDALHALPDSSIHFITRIDEPGQSADPDALLRECQRVLVPGGRLMVSAATGSPAAIQKHFLIETPAANTFDGRWLILAMKDPVSEPSPNYTETVFQNVAPTSHLSVRYAEYYQNPWILHSLVHASFRSSSPSVLVDSALRLLKEAPAQSVDFGAALCLLMYRAIDGSLPSGAPIQPVLEQAQDYLAIASPNPHQIRWQVSLSYALGVLHMRRGAFAEARQWFAACAGMDSLKFSSHLATKTTEALFWSGWLAFTSGDTSAARQAWTRGLLFGERLMQRPLSETLMNPEWPNLFDYGDGMRELTYALENVAKCANGLHCLAIHERGISIRWNLIHNTFRFQHETVTHSLQLAQSRVERLCHEIDQVRAELQSSATDVRDRTADLDRVRQELRDRTAELDRDRQALRERGEQVDKARQEAARQTQLSRLLQERLQQTIAEVGEIKITKKSVPARARR